MGAGTDFLQMNKLKANVKMCSTPLILVLLRSDKMQMNHLCIFGPAAAPYEAIC